MSRSSVLRSCIAIIAVLLAADRGRLAAGEELPFLHPLFADGMVLQRGIEAPVWGWCEPGKEVRASLAGKSATAKADASGKWMARLGPFDAGGPHTLEVAGPKTAAVKDVLIGDVWICSGQSNMEMGIAGVDGGREAIAAADHPGIRLFSVPHAIAPRPKAVPEGRWDACTPQTLGAGGWGGFSAIGYFFGKKLHEELKVPIGLIHASWGGTVAEAWTSAEALKAIPDFRDAVVEVEDLSRKTPAEIEKMVDEWWRKADPGSSAGPVWAALDLDASSWKPMDLPRRWEEAGLRDFDGLVWFRKEFNLPEGWAGKDLVLHLGTIDDRDTTWMNGVRIGGRDSWQEPREYRVPASAVRPKNVIAVRVLDTGGDGGFYGAPGDMRIEVAGESGKSLPLAGPWLHRTSAPLSKLPVMPQPIGSNPNIVTVLYNGMIAPLVPFGIKGAIWYQGESNAGRAVQYRTLLPAMIRDWRSRFGAGDFPFLIVQLANFMAADPEPQDSAWAELREAQLLTAIHVPATGLAVAIDIGDANDIHPRNKAEVGRRLALGALSICYGLQVECWGPIYWGMERQGKEIRIRFDHLGGGLVAKGERLTGFAIAGRDGKFVWADARIDGDTVVVSSPKVERPKAVRYGWGNNPACNLYNKAGLPAVPFRTDMPR
jgi:sialate O-acetylesterase